MRSREDKEDEGMKLVNLVVVAPGIVEVLPVLLGMDKGKKHPRLFFLQVVSESRSCPVVR